MKKWFKKKKIYIYIYTSVDPHIQYAVITCYNQLWFIISYKYLLLLMFNYDCLCSIMITYVQLWLLMSNYDCLCPIMIEYVQLCSNMLILLDFMNFL